MVPPARSEELLARVAWSRLIQPGNSPRSPPTNQDGLPFRTVGVQTPLQDQYPCQLEAEKGRDHIAEAFRRYAQETGKGAQEVGMAAEALLAEENRKPSAIAAMPANESPLRHLRELIGTPEDAQRLLVQLPANVKIVDYQHRLRLLYGYGVDTNSLGYTPEYNNHSEILVRPSSECLKYLQGTDHKQFNWLTHARTVRNTQSMRMLLDRFVGLRPCFHLCPSKDMADLAYLWVADTVGQNDGSVRFTLWIKDENGLHRRTETFNFPRVYPNSHRFGTDQSRVDFNSHVLKGGAKGMPIPNKGKHDMGGHVKGGQAAAEPSLTYHLVYGLPFDCTIPRGTGPASVHWNTNSQPSTLGLWKTTFMVSTP